MVDHSVNEHDAPFIIRIMGLEEKCDALRARVAELEAALQCAKSNQICRACGQPWNGEPCGQIRNGHPMAVCYPINQPTPSDGSQQRIAELEAACAVMAEALKPLAETVTYVDFQGNLLPTAVRHLTPADVKAARAVLAMQTAREAPGEAT